MKIRNKIFLYIIIPTIFIFYVLASFIVKDEENAKKEALRNKINSINEIITYVVTEPLWNYDLETLRNNIKSFFSQPEIVRIVLTEDDGRIIVNKGLGIKPDVNHKFAIKKGDTQIGQIEIGYTYHYINKEIARMKIKLYLFIGIVMIIIFLMAVIVSKIIYHPINKTVEGLKKIDEGNFNHRLRLNKNDEFKSIETYFNKMIDTLKNSNFENKKYLQEITEKNDELEAAYNDMMSINETLAETLRDFEISENKYRNIFNYAPDGMIIINSSTMRIEEFNREFLNIMEIEVVDVVNMILGDILEDSDIDMVMGKLKEQGVIYNMEITLKKVKKQTILSMIPLEHNREYIQVVIKDITQLKKLQVELENYAKSLEMKVRERTYELERANDKIKTQQEELIKDAYNRGFIEVTSGIIHNIGNIVNIINLNIEDMMEQFPENENMAIKFLKEIVYTELKMIENQSDRVKRIIDVMPEVIVAMEEFEKRVKGNFEFLMKEVTHLKEIVKLQQSYVGTLGTEDYNDINEIIREAIEIYGASIEKREINLKTDLGNPKILLCDKNQIFQVVSNLIKNAYEAIEESGKDSSGVIEIKTEHIDDNIIIHVKDNGSGIKSENMEKVFKFGFSTKKESGKGTGFGLHSAKTIVSKYGGDIDVKSEFGQGTEFIMVLPGKKKEVKESEV